MKLQEYRREIDRIDSELIRLFQERMELASQIAAYKKEYGLPVLDAGREAEKLARLAEQLPPDLRGYGEELYRHIFELSRARQRELLGADWPSDDA